MSNTQSSPPSWAKAALAGLTLSLVVAVPVVAVGDESEQPLSEYRDRLENLALLQELIDDSCEESHKVCEEVQKAYFSPDACRAQASIAASMYGIECTYLGSSEGTCLNCDSEPTGAFCAVSCAGTTFVTGPRSSLFDEIREELTAPVEEGVWQLSPARADETTAGTNSCNGARPGDSCSPIGETCWSMTGGNGDWAVQLVCEPL